MEEGAELIQIRSGVRCGERGCVELSAFGTVEWDERGGVSSKITMKGLEERRGVDAPM